MISLANPIALYGLLAALTPIIIYIILRRRRTEVPWGASYLLRRTLASKRKSSAWKQYVVLALRSLLLALIAWLICGPFRPRPEPRSLAPAMPPTPVHQVVLLDHSVSMSVKTAVRSRLDRLKTALGAILASQRPGDRTTLVSLVAPRDKLTPAPLAGKLSTAAARSALDGLALREGRLTPAAALARALAALAETPEAHARLYILSDFPPEVIAELPRLEWFRPAADARRIQVVPVGMIDPSNPAPASVAITNATFGADVLIAGVPTTLYADVVNYSDTETTARFQLTVDDLAAHEETAPLQPGQAKRLPFSVTFPAAGVASLELTARPGYLEAASRLSLSVEVKDGLRLWLLADPPDAMNPDALDEAELLRRAMVASGQAEAPLEVTEVALFQLTRPIPDDVDVVVIAGIRVVTEPIREPLRRFLRRGGGLLICMSPAVDIAAYNEAFGGLTPFSLARPAFEEVDPESFLTASLDLPKGAGGLLSEFAASSNGKLDAARIYNYMRLAPGATPAAAPLRLSNGEPLLVHQPVGRGNLFLFTSSFGISWSSFPVNRSFLPFLYRLLNAAARGSGFPRNLAPGQPFVGTWPGAESVALSTPGGDRREVSAQAGSTGAFVVLDGMKERGLYRLAGASGKGSFSVVAPPPEADLRRLDDSQAATLETTVGAPLYGDWPAAVTALGAANNNMPLWPWLLLVALGVYLIECWFVRFL